MQKLNFLGFTLLLICFAHYSHAQQHIASELTPVPATYKLSYTTKTARTQISGSLLKHESPPAGSTNWFSIQPFSDSVSILLMLFGLGLVYLADHRKKKTK